ncbi:MAG: 8-oxo-dGTP diphosphatase [Lachnospiraceae bacterium]|jgi:8-oxo-dGTP diphosphatase|nr:8-oxo-dGTP diphosphatase [Lachnospiraceae bacterium]
MGSAVMTTLCYIEQDGKYLMLHRTGRKQDLNRDKWLGIGGHFEFGESPEDCIRREVREETGLILTDYRFRGLVTFVSGTEQEYMCLYTATGFCGELFGDCAEGSLEWVEKQKVACLNIWEGDRIFLDLLASEHPFFSLKLRYDGDRLVEAVLDGSPLF